MPSQNTEVNSDRSLRDHPAFSRATDNSNHPDELAAQFKSQRQLDHIEKQLAIDLSKHRNNADKLFSIATDLQSICKEQRAYTGALAAENVRLRESQQTASNLIKSQSTGSTRRTTEESNKSGVEDTRTGIAVIFNPSDHGLTVRPRKGMKDSRYIVADLPPFHWWSDCFHIYFDNESDQSITSKDQPKVVVQTKKLSSSSNLTFIRTIKLGQLGVRFKLRRILKLGKLDVIYVQSPDSRSSQSVELTQLSHAHGAIVSR